MWLQELTAHRFLCCYCLPGYTFAIPGDILARSCWTVTHFLSHLDLHASNDHVSHFLKLDTCFQVSASSCLQSAFTYWCWDQQAERTKTGNYSLLPLYCGEVLVVCHSCSVFLSVTYKYVRHLPTMLSILKCNGGQVWRSVSLLVVNSFLLALMLWLNYGSQTLSGSAFYECHFYIIAQPGTKKEVLYRRYFP